MFNFELKDGLKVKFTHYGRAQEGYVKIDTERSEVIIVDDRDYGYAPEQVHDLRPAKGFWPVMGDVLYATDVGRTVLAVVGNVYLLSEISYSNQSGICRTREELINGGYTIKGQIETITLEEAEKRLGVRIEVRK